MASDVPVLVCTAGALAGQRITVPEGGLDIGRAEGNHVVIEDEGVSRFHARLLYDNGSLWLQDAGSRNGVFVNGARVTGHQALKVGDELTVALHTFKIRWADETGAPSPGRSARGSGDGLDAARGEGGSRRDPSDADAPRRDPNDTDARRRRWFWPFG